MTTDHDPYEPPRVTRRGTRQAAGWTAWGILGAAAAIVALIVIATMFIFGWGWFQRGTADFRGKTGVIEKRANAGYRIQNYEKFYDLCASVQTKQVVIENLRQQKTEADPGSIDYRVVSGQLTGTIASRADDINQYNADARKADTAGHFRASDLPYQLDVTEENITCTAP